MCAVCHLNENIHRTFKNSIMKVYRHSAHWRHALANMSSIQPKVNAYTGPLTSCVCLALLKLCRRPVALRMSPLSGLANLGIILFGFSGSRTTAHSQKTLSTRATVVLSHAALWGT